MKQIERIIGETQLESYQNPPSPVQLSRGFNLPDINSPQKKPISQLISKKGPSVKILSPRVSENYPM
jgi:hypothetical protein